MLVAEYDYDTDVAVQREESGRIAFAKGIEQGIQRGIEQGIEQGIQRGIERGIEQGIQQGFSDGAYQKALETAKLMRYENLGIDLISKVTGLSKEEIEAL